MSTELFWLLYALVGLQHARVWTRNELKDHSSEENLLPLIWTFGFGLWPLVDAISILITLCERFPSGAKRLVVASPGRSEKKQLKRKELEARVAELEKELELDS